MFKKGQEYWQPVLSSLYAMLRQDPLANSKWLLSKLGYAYFQSEGDELVNEQTPETLMGQQPPQGQFAAQVQGQQSASAAKNIV